VHVARTGEGNFIQGFAEKNNLRERTHFEDLGIRCECNIEMKLLEVGWGS